MFGYISDVQIMFKSSKKSGDDKRKISNIKEPKNQPQKRISGCKKLAAKVNSTIVKAF